MTLQHVDTSAECRKDEEEGRGKTRGGGGGRGGTRGDEGGRGGTRGDKGGQGGTRGGGGEGEE